MQDMKEEQYWQAVLTRDMRSDGAFVYGVRSTRVYCNPSCPSRKPRREQVRFFASPRRAEEAGFRPCRRCHPEESTGEPHVELVRRACDYIEAHSDESITLSMLGAQVNMSPFHLQRVFKQIMGITPHQYSEACRLRRLKARLKEGEDVTTALYDAGYSSSSRLYERAPEQLGMTPVAYRRGGLGMKIHYTIVDSEPGRLLVAATEKGICSVCLGDDDERLEAALLAEYPAAEVERELQSPQNGVNKADHGMPLLTATQQEAVYQPGPKRSRDFALSEWVSELLCHLQGQQPHLDLPVDVQATAFQWRVWQELSAIPYGETRSYSEIARRLGDPDKRRAVAHACATNPVAIVIPCHRVVRSDGTPGGYRWGVERKERLLAREREAEKEPVR
jgi:AraC family transcriptional regulator of adaptative response/methylated-DNA-[protein]-cysteine methyltransferase